MKKYILLLPLLFGACYEPNKAKIIAQSQAPDAKCDASVTVARDIAIAVCVLSDKSEVIAIFSDKHPFQAFRIKNLETIKAEEAAKKTPPTPPAGTGSGAGAEAPPTK